MKFKGGDKDFLEWHRVKASLHKKSSRKIYFHKREIWWCSIGLNVGHEQDGKNNTFRRPVLILRVYNSYLFLGIPLTSAVKAGKYYYTIEYSGKLYTIILSQIRCLSTRRLLRKIRTISEAEHADVISHVKKLI